jgi:8-oxo-dGTP diphosphatase
LKKLEEKDREGSKKGAYFYQFYKKEYNRLLESGYNFEVNV